MSFEIAQITAGTAYLDGNSLLGKLETFGMPEITVKVAEYIAAGMIAPFDLPVGFEKMEATAKFKSIFPDEFAKLYDIFTPVELQVRSPREIWQNNKVIRTESVLTAMTALPKKLPIKHEIGQGKRTEHECTFNVYRIKQSVDGRELFELDVMNNIFRVNGVDRLADWRAAQGQ